MERCFDRIPVKPGDAFVVPGGLPHAIGGGVLMVEVMEPTDFVARVEFQVGGRAIPEPGRFMGRDVDFALDMFSLETVTAATVQSRWRCTPLLVEERAGLRRESLVDERSTDRFHVLRTAVAGRTQWRPEAFTILLVIDGQCTVTTKRERVSLAKFDRILVPHGSESLEIEADRAVIFLECQPPRALKQPPS
jgi:mannose-6-phosphate isomerase